MLNEQIEQDLSTLLNGRAGAVPSAPLRRVAITGNSSTNGPSTPDAPAMAAQSTEEGLASTERPAPEGIEHSAISLFALGANNRVLLTFIELEGYPILRVAINGECTDLILNNDQVKLLLRQMTLWLTR